MAPSDKLPPAWLDAAGALYLAGTRKAAGPLDVVTAKFLRAHKGLGDDGRGFVVDTAQGMLRQRRRLEAAVSRVPFECTRGALACLWLLGERGVEARTLPIDPRGAPALVAAWRSTDADPLPVRASLPSWLVDELARARPDGEALCLACTAAPPTTLRANTLRTSREQLLTALAAEGIDAEPCTLAPDGVTLRRRTNVFRTRAFHDGLFEMQDEGSQLVSHVCEATPGMTVVDACAGAGGKTLHLAALMQGKGALHAFDVAGHRLEALRERAARAGAHNVRAQDLRDKGARKSRERLADGADVVLVDAPCTGTGVLRRNPDTAWTLVADDVARLVGQQAEILAEAAVLVKPGGRLVYATCSLLAAENRGTMASFLAAHPAFSLLPVDEVLARQGIHVPGVADVLETDPLRHGTDGFFACALVRA